MPEGGLCLTALLPTEPRVGAWGKRSKGILVLIGVGHVQRTAVQAHYSPIPIPVALGALLGDRTNQVGVELAQRLGAQAS